MRPRTLPVSVAGVAIGVAYGLLLPPLRWLPALLCLVFALLAQIASNFANEYYDYKGGLDRKGREGPRRGVTEGDITPAAMRRATFITLAAACCVGCGLIAFAGWWLVGVGAFIAIGVLAYSTGPYPLSHHALGEVAVVVFYGVIPVCFTYFLMAGQWPVEVMLGGLAAGLLGANVLIVNNYRDIDDDRAVGKRTLAVVKGRPFCGALYLANGVLAVALMAPSCPGGGSIIWWSVAAIAFLSIHLRLWRKLRATTGSALNPLLGATARSMLIFAMLFILLAAIG